MSNKAKIPKKNIVTIISFCAAFIICLFLYASPQKVVIKNDFIILLKEKMMFRKISPPKYGKKNLEFYLLETEVTNRMYRQFLIDVKKNKNDREIWEIANDPNRQITSISPSYSTRNKDLLWDDNMFPIGKGDYPVALVDMDDALSFCLWLTQAYPELGTFRLPTVEEWIIAAYGKNRSYPWGNKWVHDYVCCSGILLPSRKQTKEAIFRYDNQEKKSTESVRKRPQGTTPEGLYGMWGNVSEFVLQSNTGGTFPGFFVSVGGRWMGGGFDWNCDGSKKRVNYWGYTHSSKIYQETIGFRVLLDHNDKEHSFYERKKENQPIFLK